jgi:3-oxoadipate enol-lactonase
MPSIHINGATLFYSEQGGGDEAETLVFSHGLLMDSSMWDLLLPLFSPHYRVICFDHRGQGQSEHSGRGFDIDQLVQDAAALIQAISKTPVHYVGLSMGGMVGMPLAVRHPALLKSLVLLNTSAQAEPKHRKAKYAAMKLIVKLVGTKPLARKIMPMMFGKSMLKNPEQQALVGQWQRKVAGLKKTILGPVSGVVDRRDITQELKQIRCPTLIIAGEEDTVTPVSCARHMHQHIAHSKLHIIAQCGHGSALEKPDVVADAMKDFYSKMD